jgi:hypothetical protein
MDGLAWFATTPEGQRLGKLAAQTVRLELTPLPWWFAPLEPFRWLDTLVSDAPHAKFTGMIYAAIALSVGVTVLWRCRRRWWQRVLLGASAAINTLLALSGLHIAMMWLLTAVPHGTRWVVPEGAPFVLANFHAHSHFSAGGVLSPEQLVLWHQRKGYRVVAITDSNTPKGSLRAEGFVRRHRLPIVLVTGEEFRGKTHLLLLGLRQDVTPSQADVPKAIRLAQRLGALVIAAHAWTGRHSYGELMAWGVEGFEVANSGALADATLQRLCRRHRLTVVGNLDFRAGNMPKVATVLPAGATTPAKVLDALRKGHCAVLYDARHAATGYHWLRARLSDIAELWETGQTTSLLGFGLWLLVGWCWWRKKGKGQRKNGPLSFGRWWVAIGAQIALALAVGAVTLWAMAADFKGGWFPPIESVVLTWAVACPLNWFLWAKSLQEPLPAKKATT